MSRARSRVLSNRLPEPPEQPGPVADGRTVLCLEDHPHAASGIVEQLQRHEGIHVVYCHPPTATEICVGVAGGRCPLSDPVTVVLDARGGTDDHLTPGELGVVCAEQTDLPIVAAGPSRPSRQEVPWASATCGLDDAAQFCASLMSSPLSLRDLGIDHAVRRILSRDFVGDVAVSVTDWTRVPVVSVCSDRLPHADSCSAIDLALRALLSGEHAVVYTTRGPER